MVLSSAFVFVTASACSGPRKASVRFLMRVQVSDSFGTYSSTGVWRSELRRPLLDLNRSYDTKFTAPPIVIELPHSGQLTVHPVSQLNGWDGPFLIPERAFRPLVRAPSSERLQALASISHLVGESARLNCRYGQIPDPTVSSRELVSATICPSISFRPKSELKSIALDESSDPELIALSKTIVITVKVLGA